MKPITNTDFSLQVLQEESQNTDGIYIRYALYAITLSRHTYYAIEIFTDEESDMRILSHSPERAQKLFRLITHELVTPCTLPYVLHDLES